MSDAKICPFFDDNGNWIKCKESECMAWREIDHNDWDCALIRGKKCQ